MASPQRDLYEPVRSSRAQLVRVGADPEAALDPYPSVALVLNSTWCIRPGYSATLKRLPASLRSRFIGGTYHKRVHGADPWNLAMFRGMPRGEQVLEDALRRKPRQWLALDDDLEGWPEACRENFPSSPARGRRGCQTGRFSGSLGRSCSVAMKSCCASKSDIAQPSISAS